ncbi:MAG TPA: hypothetical protein VJ179_01015 [Patescibacteria group bacterium]|nr:hypothetical protein [Patescibacteria group bacterium]
MVDITQILLVFVIISLTSILIIIGIQLILILQEVRKFLLHVNELTEKTDLFFERITNPLNSLSGVVSGISSVFHLVRSLREKNRDSKEE